MSEENVEIVRALFEAWNAGDMDAFRELYDPDAIMRMAENWPTRLNRDRSEALEAAGLSE
jgi:ketosteroid isomerase-like protein